MEKAVSWKKILILAIAVCLFAGIIVKCNQFQKTPLASYKGQKYEKAVVTKIILQKTEVVMERRKSWLK